MADKLHQNLAIIGHVDRGKSTLVGRLLFETGSVPEHIIEQHRKEATPKGKPGFEFTYVVDNLAEERECDVTINIAHQRFDTGKYYFTIIDTPGRRDSVKNMITGASQADHAILVVVADDGIASRTREYVFLVRTLGIEELIITINKMDVANYSENSYKQVKEEVQQLLQQVRFNSDDADFIPISAFEGDNVAGLSENMTWFGRPTVLRSLSNLPEPSPPTDASLRVPIRDAYTISGIGTVPVDRVEMGMLRTGDNIRLMPSDTGGGVKTIEMHHEEVPEAGPGDNIDFNVRGVGEDGIHRDDICGPADDSPSIAKTFTARIVVMQHPSVITVGYTPIIHVHTAQIVCMFKSLGQKLDPTSGKVAEEKPDFIKADDAAVVTLRLRKPLSIKPSSEIAELGGFAIRDIGQTIATSRILGISE